MKRLWLVPLLFVALVGCGVDPKADGLASGAVPGLGAVPQDGAAAAADVPSEEPTQPAAAPVPPAAEFTSAVDHPYFPLAPGMVRIFEGDKEGMSRRDEIRVLKEPRVITGVACAAVFQEVYFDGVLAEITTEWFAQSSDGSVWKFGEETFELQDGGLVRMPDSWVAGESGAVAWMALGADPTVGERYVVARPGGRDVLVVVSLTATADVPAGRFANCLQVLENPDDPDDQDIVLYAGGVGMVSEENADGTIELVSTGDD